MKFSIFADFHYAPGSFDPDPEAKLEKLRYIQKRAEKENASFIIHAGDLCHAPSRYPELINLYNDFHIPSYHCLGNHDTDGTPLEEVLKLYRMEDVQYYFDCEGYRFIVFDPNYSLINGEYVHFDMGNYYKTPDERDWIPPENIEWLRETIEASPYPCILVGHSSFERPDGVKNRKDVLKMINEVNAKRKHSVLMVISGHFHRDYIRLLDGVCHLDLNSASYDWISVAHDHFPEELRQKARSIGHMVIYNDPVHAIITLEGTTVTIDGMESSFFMGIGREHTAVPYLDPAGRECTPNVSSAKFTLL
ncbi:MAG: hypothetical protein E7665_07415 [Ruminococcaceae bacterium]|nr:hypothetical protein [Oscillospiraceae bacterium]